MSVEVTNRYQLTREIIALSVANNWEEAKLEWQLDSVHREDKPDQCLCGHYPIVEICALKNRLNGKYAIVGNVCVKRFLGLESDLIFEGLKRIATDQTRAMNIATVQHAYSKKWIDSWQLEFLTDTARKRKLSDKQLAKRIEINKKILVLTRNTLRNREAD